MTLNITNIGSHRVSQGSLVGPQVDAILAGERVQVLYSDPPWGDGNLLYWQTMNRKMTGAAVAQVSHDQMRDRILDLVARYVDGYLFIETGLRWAGYWMDAMTGAGLRGVHRRKIWYGSKAKPIENVLIIGTVPGAPELTLGDVEHLNGPHLGRHCVGLVAKPGAVVLDPCCGMGYTARAAVAASMRFRGNELNAARLAKTIKFLEASARKAA